ncbi:MAG TPA: STAS domain-containing protein [Pantanalinema sp.]
MPIAIQPREADGLIALDGDLTIYTALELKDQLLAPLSTFDALELDLSGVTEIDSAGAQLILLVRKEAARMGKTVRLGPTSPTVHDLLDLYGIRANHEEAHA